MTIKDNDETLRKIVEEEDNKIKRLLEEKPSSSVYPLEKEEKIVKKAIGDNLKHRGQRTLPFYGEENFIEMITQIYPSACHIIIANLDNRDFDNSPKITLKTLRHQHITHVTTTNVFGRTEHSLRNNVMTDIFAFVEGDRATIKLFKTTYDGVF